MAPCAGPTTKGTSCSIRWVRQRQRKSCCFFVGYASVHLAVHVAAPGAACASVQLAVQAAARAHPEWLPGLPCRCPTSPCCAAAPLPAGNLLVNPGCALLFLDFSSGDALLVAGEGQVLHKDRELPGAQVGALGAGAKRCVEELLSAPAVEELPCGLLPSCLRITRQLPWLRWRFASALLPPHLPRRAERGAVCGAGVGAPAGGAADAAARPCRVFSFQPRCARPTAKPVA